MFKSEASSWKSVRGSNSLLLIGFQFSAPKAVESIDLSLTTNSKRGVDGPRTVASRTGPGELSTDISVNLITVHVKISLNAMAVLFGVDYARNQFEAGICRSRRRPHDLRHTRLRQ
ncbi:hypothetical protein KCV05_g75, partial [Aureobasidium melanogenum]